MGRRNRRREKLSAPVSEYANGEGNVLRLRGSLPPAARLRYAATFAGGLEREDALQRATELLFELLAVSWTIARDRMATAAERQFVRESLREHGNEHFPEMEAP